MLLLIPQIYFKGWTLKRWDSIFVVFVLLHSFDHHCSESSEWKQVTKSVPNLRSHHNHIIIQLNFHLRFSWWSLRWRSLCSKQQPATSYTHFQYYTLRKNMYLQDASEAINVYGTELPVPCITTTTPPTHLQILKRRWLWVKPIMTWSHFFFRGSLCMAYFVLMMMHSYVGITTKESFKVRWTMHCLTRGRNEEITCRRFRSDELWTPLFVPQHIIRHCCTRLRMNSHHINFTLISHFICGNENEGRLHLNMSTINLSLWKCVTLFISMRIMRMVAVNIYMHVRTDSDGNP